MKHTIKPVIIFFLIANINYSVAQTKPIPRDTSFTAIGTFLKTKKNFPFVKLVKDSLPENLTVFKDVVYSVITEPLYGKRELKLNIYRKKDKKKYPVVIFIHGGGWSSGDKSMEIPLAQHIAEYGYVTIPIEYRLLPEATYPAAIYDIKTAVRWVHAHAKKYNMDASRIAISGTSAGGHLAALVGMTNYSTKHEGKREYAKYSSAVQAVIDIDGILSFVTQSNIDETNEKIQKLGGQLPKNAQWLGGKYSNAKENWEQASPIINATEKSAPICFINSMLPRYHDARDELIVKLNSYNIYNETHQIDVNLHPFWLFEPWFQDVVKYSVAFLGKTLKKQGS